MKFNPIIVNYLSRQCGCDVTSPGGATILAYDIEAKTGEKLTPNTLKRLVGVIPYEFNPRPSTLEILAKYLGFPSWKLFLDTLNNQISDFDGEDPFIEVGKLNPGVEISFKWDPDREIRLCHLGEGRCEVLSVVNSKLRVGDILWLSQIAEGYPLIAKDVVRDGKSIGCYTTAKINGISDILIK